MDAPQRPEATIARPSENTLNLLHLVGDKSVPDAGQPAVPTTDQLRTLLSNAERIRIFSAGNAQQLVGDQISQLDKGDLKTIADIAATLKKEPFDPKAMDKVLEPYGCFPDRLRNLLNPLDLWLQKEGIDRFQQEQGRPGFAVDGGYEDSARDRSKYDLTINRDREKPFYKFVFGESCS